MKRVVSSSIITFLVLIAAAAAFLYFRNFTREQGNPVACIPSDAVFYIEASSVSEAVESLLKPSMWQAWMGAPELASLNETLRDAKKLAASEAAAGTELFLGKAFVSAHVTGAGTFDFLFLKGTAETKESISSMVMEMAGEKAVATEREYDGNLITEIQLENGKVFTWTLVKGVFTGSYTSFLVEDALRQQKVGKPAVWSSSQPEQDQTFRFCLNFSTLPAFIALYTKDEQGGVSALRNFSSWFSSEAETSADGIILNGSLENVDSLRFTHCFTEQQPVKCTVIPGLPSNTAAVLWYGVSDMRSYRNRLDRYNGLEESSDLIAAASKRFGTDIMKSMTSWVAGEYALVITEPSSLQYDNSVYAVFRTADPDKARKSLKSLTGIVDKKLQEKTREEEYHGHTIAFLRLQGVIPALYGQMFSRLTRMYYTIIGNQVVFANQASSLRNYIDEIRAAHTLEPRVKGIIPSQGANFACIIRPEPSLPVFSSVANQKWRTEIEKYREVAGGSGMFSFIMTAVQGSYSATARLDRVSRPGTPARMLFSIESDTSVSMKPLLAYDKTTGAGRVVFQDDGNRLYMADDAGNVIWKTGLDSRIVSEIYPVDYFRNGKMQFLFNTPGHIHLIDAEGKPVGNYPIRLPSAATNGITLAPAEAGKEDVIYIACDNKKVYAYLLSGRPLQGWNFVGTTGVVSAPVLSFTSGGKQLLLITDNEGTANVVTGTGNVAVSLSQGFTPAANAVIYTDSTAGSSTFLVTSDENGNIIKVSSDGKVEVIPVSAASAGHGFLYSDADADGQPDYIFASGREIIAYDASMTMLYRQEIEGDLEGGIQPVLLPSGEKGFGAFSKSLNKTWLFRMDGKTVEGFPVRGSGGFTTGSLNSDGQLNLITGGRGSGVYVYSLN